MKNYLLIFFCLIVNYSFSQENKIVENLILQRKYLEADSILKAIDQITWEALVRPSRKVPPGTEFTVSPEMTIQIGEDLRARN